MQSLALNKQCQKPKRRLAMPSLVAKKLESKVNREKTAKGEENAKNEYSNFMVNYLCSAWGAGFCIGLELITVDS